MLLKKFFRINLEMQKVIFDVADHKAENLTKDDALRMSSEELLQGHFSFQVAIRRKILILKTSHVPKSFRCVFVKRIHIYQKKKSISVF